MDTVGALLTGKISVSQHAISRAVERFRVPKLTADEWIRTNLRKATFVANIVSDDGKPNRLFAYQRIAFAVDAESDYVYTVYAQNNAVTPLQRKISAILKRELAAAERKERVTERRVRVEKARLSLYIAECRLRMEMTPSKAVVVRNNSEIDRFSGMMAALDNELLTVKREKASLAKSIVAYL